MYALALIRYRRPLEEVVAHQEAHRAFQRKLKDEGTLLAAGPHDPRYGGMMLVRVADNDPQKALDAIRDADPYYQAGVVQYELLVWNVVIGKESLDRL
ncbi:MAG TPA: YciI family protein [Vicinamibacterales bacterium]|nr:YciI family protein [Vicinamibacterales bacterium]